jgi:hypothetical protein
MGIYPLKTFSISDPGLSSLCNKTLCEGEYSVGTVSLNLSIIKGNNGSGIRLYQNARQLHVIDSIGKYHRLSLKAHKKLKKSLATFLDENNMLA